jgi:hypothetical protein
LQHALRGRPGTDRNFYRDRQAAIDAKAVFTLDLDSGLDTKRRYTRAKIIDMIFFQEGLNKGRRNG